MVYISYESGQTSPHSKYYMGLKSCFITGNVCNIAVCDLSRTCPHRSWVLHNCTRACIPRLLRRHFLLMGGASFCSAYQLNTMRGFVGNWTRHENILKIFITSVLPATIFQDCGVKVVGGRQTVNWFRTNGTSTLTAVNRLSKLS